MKTRIVATVLLLLVAGTAGGTPDFVIVSPPDLRAAWEVYAGRRHAARPDLDIAVTGTDAIYAAHPFGPGLPCRNAAESVHAYIREAAQAGTTHFLLGGMWLDARAGDTNALYFATGERLSLSNCVPGICAHPYADTDSKGGDIPSDMYYACLDDPANGIVHPWDPSGDGVYLSADEFASCDCVPDVAVGRFAAVPYAYGGTTPQSPSELVLAYAGKVSRGTQSSFSGLHRVGVASGKMVRAYESGSRDLGYAGKEICFYDDVPNLWDPAHPDPVADTECAIREMFRTVIASNWPVLDVEALHGTGPAFAARYPNMSSALTAFFATDMLYATCRSHGSATSTTGVNLTLNRYAKATGLTLFGDFCMPCLTGSVDQKQLEGGRMIVLPSLGIAATCSPVGGFLASVHNSRYGWTSEFDSNVVADGFSGSLSQFLARRLFVHGDTSIGLAHLHARQEYVAAYSMTSTRVYALCEQMLYGDPTLGLPTVVKTRTWAGDLNVTTDVATVSATFTADAVVTGTGRLKIMDALSCHGTNLTLSVPGGVGRIVAFTGSAPGALTLSGTPFYLGGITNCASVALRGGGKTCDVTRTDGALATLTADGSGTPNATNVLRGVGNIPFIAVTNSALRLAPGPQWALSGAAQRLTNRIALATATLAVDAETSVVFGMRDGTGLHPFRLDVDGACALVPATAEASAGLVGTTWVELAEDAELAMGLPLYNVDAGGIVFSGPGAANASVRALAGTVEVRDGAALVLETVPLPAVTALVVRAGATLRIPSDTTGLHTVLVGTGRLIVEEGAVVEDLAGNVLAGRAMNGMFFEPGAALCWRGGVGAWSDAHGWYDVVTGVSGAWADGRIAVFADAADVTNDCADAVVKGFMFGADVSVGGAGIRLATGFVEVPSNTTVTISAPLASADDLVKAGEGTLVLRGTQALAGGIAARAGVLELDNLDAPSATNLAVEAGSSLALRGDSVLPHASARRTLAVGTLRRATEEPASLNVEAFVPVSRFIVPDGVTIRAAADYGLWKMTVNGRLECRTIPSMCINSWIDGTGTVRTVGLWTDTTAYARFSFCRLEMAAGAFQVLGSPGAGIQSRYSKNFLFDGVTFAPVGGDVHVTNSDLPEGLVSMCVNTNGVVFDTFDVSSACGRTVFFDDPDASNLFFWGPGDVTKIGAGAVRFTETVDQHEGRTIVQGGTYEVSTWSFSSGFVVTGAGSTATLSCESYEGDVSVGTGGVFDLSDPAVTVVATTNLQLAAGAVLKVCVTPDGCDLVDAREGTCELPSDGEVMLDVTVRPDTPPGLYAVLASSHALPSCWEGRFTTPGRQPTELVFAADRTILCVRVRRAGTVLILR